MEENENKNQNENSKEQDQQPKTQISGLDRVPPNFTEVINGAPEPDDNNQRKSLPPFDQLPSFVEKMLEKGKLAELKTYKLTPAQIANGDTELIEWNGDLDSVIFLGYPFLTKITHTDHAGNVVGRDPKLLDLGIPIKQLYWSDENHAFVCVRSDVYA